MPVAPDRARTIDTIDHNLMFRMTAVDSMGLDRGYSIIRGAHGLLCRRDPQV
jgi:hypothetical protein